MGFRSTRLFESVPFQCKGTGKTSHSNPRTKSSSLELSSEISQRTWLSKLFTRHGWARALSHEDLKQPCP
ncbi:hypothetical protein ACTXT7_010412 [Hymenolepis weldensis]